LKKRSTSDAVRAVCEALELRCLLNAPGANYTLAFDDEFNGTSMAGDTNWSNYLPWTSNHYEGGNYLDYMVNTNQTINGVAYTSNVTESGGQLHLNTQSITSNPITVNSTTFDYTGAMMTTSGIFSTEYGYAEIRAQLPQGQGNWPAFWSLGNGWPPENDIMEDWPTGPRFHQGLYGMDSTWHDYDDTSSSTVPSSTFHIYSMQWGPGFENFYVDGVQEYSYTSSANVPSESMYFLLNSGVASGEVGSYSNSADNELNVDWVRIYTYTTPSGPGVANPSFNTASNYTLSGSAAYNIGTNLGYTGNGDLHEYGAPGEADQVLNGLTPNTTYTFSAFAEVGSGSTLGVIGVKNFDSNNTVISSPIGAVTTPASWVQGSVEYTTGSSNTSATIYLANQNSNNLNFDDLNLANATTLASISGFAGQPGAVTNVPLNVSEGSAGGFYSLSATSSNTALVANTGLTITNGILKVTPVGSQTGTTTITVSGTDAFDTPISESFPLTISNGISYTGDAGGVTTNDNFRLVRDGANVDVYINNTTTTPSSQFPYASFSVTNISGLTGNNSLVVDYSGGDPVTSGGISWSAGTGGGTNTLSIINLSGNNAITTTSGATLQIGGDVINYTNVATLNLDLGSGTNTLTSTSPTTLPTITLTEDTGGTTTMASGSGTLPTHTVLSIASGGTFSFNNETQSINQIIGAGTLSLGTSTLTIGSQNGTSTFSGNITGSGTITKTGTGMLVLSGSDSFTGTVNIGTGSNPAGNGAGILRVTTSGALAHASSLFLNDNNGSYDLFQIDGTNGPVTLPSSLAITLDANNFAGPQGAPATIFESIAGNNTVAGPITFQVGGAGYGIQSDAGTLSFTDPYTLTHIIFLRGAGNGAFTNVLSGVGSITMQGTGNWSLSGANTYTGTTIISTGQLTDANNTGIPTASTLTLTTGATLGLQGSIAITRTLTITGSGNGGVGSLVNVSGNNTWSSPLTLAAGGATIGSTAGTLTLAAISGGPLTTVGAGTIALSSSDSYTGGTNINGAVVNFSALSALGTGNINFGGGTLQYATGNTIDISTRTVTLGSGGGTIDTNGNNVSFANSIGNGGAGSFTKAGAGSLVLNGINFTGNTTVTGGTLEVAAGNLVSGTLSTSAGATLTTDPGVTIAAAPNITDNGTINLNLANSSQTFASLNGAGLLNLNNPTAITVTGGGAFSGTILPAGSSLTITGGTLALSGAAASPFSAGININGGTLNFAALNNLGSGPINFGGGTLQYAPGNTADISGSTVTLNAGGGTIDTNGNNVSFASPIGNGGSGSLTKIGAGTLTLTSSDTYGGATNINGGVLNFSALNNLGTGTALNFGGGTLQYATGNTADISTLTVTLGVGTIDTNGNNVTFANPIGNGGSGSLTKTGSGVLALSGATYTGGTNINGGTLELISGASLLGATVSISSGSVLTVDSGAALSSSTTLNDQGVANINNAAQTISTLNSSGTVNLGAANVLTITAGGDFSGVITDPTATVIVAGGSLVLSGVNTYSGDTDITAGTLEIASPGSLASINVNISSGAALIVDPGASISSTTNLTNNGTATFNDASQTIASGSGGGTLNLVGGPLTFSNGGTISGPVNGDIVVAGGLLTLTSASTITSPSITVDATATTDINGLLIGNPTVVVSGNLNFGAADANNDPASGILAYNLGSLTVTPGGDLVVTPATSSATRVVITATYLLNTSGTLDLTNNDMIVFGNESQGIPGQGGTTGPDPAVVAGEVTSSSAAADPTLMTLAALQNAGQFSTFDGQPTNIGDVLIKYTFFGDADLSGVVDASDYTLIDNGFNSQSGPDPLSGWFNGDFNGDGQINGDDYSLIDNAYNTEQSASSMALPANQIATNTAQIAAASHASVFAVEPIAATAASSITVDNTDNQELKKRRSSAWEMLENNPS
jgi:autotransporter-associated beta strand protein